MDVWTKIIFYPNEFETNSEQQNIELVDLLDFENKSTQNDKNMCCVYLCEKPLFATRSNYKFNRKMKTKTINSNILCSEMVNFESDVISSSDFMNLFIRTLTGKNITVHGDNDMMVGNLCEQIENKEGIPVYQQRLVFNGKQLELDRTLSSYNITNESLIFLVLQLRGGMYTEVSGRNGKYLPIKGNICYDMITSNFYDI